MSEFIVKRNPELIERSVVEKIRQEIEAISVVDEYGYLQSPQWIKQVVLGIIYKHTKGAGYE